jgi:hypothetical protein
MAYPPPVFAMPAATADSCRVYNFYVGVANTSACSESPSAWPQGSNYNAGWRRAQLCDPRTTLISGEPITLKKLGSAMDAAHQGLERPRAKCRSPVGMTSANIAR